MARIEYFPLASMTPVPQRHWDGKMAVDIFAPDGTAVIAPFDGFATSYFTARGGHAITLEHADGTAAYFAHLQESGTSGPVKAGQVIGREGHSGNADQGNGAGDSHLHFALATSAGVFAENDGGGDIPPWDALADVDAAPGRGIPAAAIALGLLGLGALLWARR